VASSLDGRGFALALRDRGRRGRGRRWRIRAQAITPCSPGRGNKGVGPESPLNADQIERIAGGFTLVPLRPGVAGTAAAVVPASRASPRRCSNRFTAVTINKRLGHDPEYLTLLLR